jgi:hypothetical protein
MHCDAIVRINNVLFRGDMIHDEWGKSVDIQMHILLYSNLAVSFATFSRAQPPCIIFSLSSKTLASTTMKARSTSSSCKPVSSQHR